MRKSVSRYYIYDYAVLSSVLSAPYSANSQILKIQIRILLKTKMATPFEMTTFEPMKT